MARQLVGEMQDEITEHRKSIKMVAIVIAVWLLAMIVAALVGSEIMVALIAAVGMFGTALAVLGFVIFTRT